MDHIRFGRTGLRVSRLCLGTMTFGFQCDDDTSFAIMDAAHDAGITFFDTADIYPIGGPVETIVLGAASALLLDGANVLAIQVHNAGAGSSDLTMIADLRIAAGTPIALVSSGDTWRYFVGVSQPSVGGAAPPPAGTPILGMGPAWFSPSYDSSWWLQGPGGWKLTSA